MVLTSRARTADPGQRYTTRRIECGVVEGDTVVLLTAATIETSTRSRERYCCGDQRTAIDHNADLVCAKAQRASHYRDIASVDRTAIQIETVVAARAGAAKEICGEDCGGRHSRTDEQSVVVGHGAAAGEVEEFEHSGGEGEVRCDIHTAVAAAASAADAILEGQGRGICGKAIEIDAMVAAESTDTTEPSQRRTDRRCQCAVEVDAIVVRAAAAVETTARPRECDRLCNRRTGEVDAIFAGAEAHGACAQIEYAALNRPSIDVEAVVAARAGAAQDI